MRVHEGRPLEVPAGEPRPLQVRVGEICPLEVRAPKIHVPQIDRMQVESAALASRAWREAATAKHRQARLYARGSDLQLGHLVDRCGGVILTRQTRRPRDVTADERGEDLADRGAVGRRVTGNPLQRKDSTEPHVKLGVAELVDRAGEPLDDLPLLRDLELRAAVGDLPVGKDRAHKQHHATKPLQQGRPDLVCTFRLASDRSCTNQGGAATSTSHSRPTIPMVPTMIPHVRLMGESSHLH